MLSELLGSFHSELTCYPDGVRIGLMTMILKSHDKKLWRHCVSAKAYRNVNFIVLRSTKYVLYEIESIIKSLVYSNLELNPLKGRNIYKRSHFRQTI